MTAERKSAIIIGVLILGSTTTFMIGDNIVGGILSGSGFLEQAFPNAQSIGLGILLQIVNDFAVIGIGLVFYPLLAQYNPRIALIYQSTRIIEGSLLLVSGAVILLFIPLSQQYLQAFPTELGHFETVGIILKSAKYQLFQLAMITLSVGSFFLCYLLYKERLIPRVLTVLGFLGYGMLLCKVVVETLGYSTAGQILYLPGTLFELALPLWLIFKGFRPLSISKRG
ncbi:MAG TPA: hypothetical protein DCE41_20245 [Cytophagales bacterium]|nr:hypothetical protein [Cytophagales bacterium]HAA20639.1 hypothetical protein [Cytophagales bacterium]HAP61544.1 hypothetical protein [Cytophagales bacterium]